MVQTCGYDSNGVARTPAPGFDCTVWTPAGLWGFCPTTVDTASDCGLAGYCVDSGPCSTGCGPFSDNSGITTFTCTGTQSCSFLISQNTAGQFFNYVGCGVATTQTLYASPPPVKASSTSAAATSATSSASISAAPSSTATSPQSAASTSSSSSDTSGTSPLTSQSQSQNAIVSTSGSAAPSSATSAASATQQAGHSGSQNHSTPLGAIIGGTLGGIAIICLTVFAIFFIRRRRAESGPTHPDHSSRPLYDQRGYQDEPFEAAESSPHYQNYPQKQVLGPFEAQATRDPAELPTHRG